MSADTETVEVPAGINAVSVSAWFAQNVPQAAAPLRFELIAGGRSNLTYRVHCADGNSVVLRRPPLGHVLATAHDMGREHKIISGVGLTDVPVPATIALCEDPEVNDAPFYVMSYEEGAVLHSADESALVPDAERMPLSRRVADVLAELHAIEPDDVGLGDLGRREDYLGRQLRRWTRQWEQSKTRELPIMDEVAAVLAARKPDQIGAAIVHGDYRLGNMLTGARPTGARPNGHWGIVAVLDWELCTLGDPLADVGFLMNNWVSPDEPSAGSSAPTQAGGFASRTQMLDWYCDASGRDVSGVEYYRAFSYWRLAAISEGVLNRYLHGAMADAQETDTSVFRDSVDFLSASAAERLAIR
ncbi:phosphotransferase family protein [Candidatus Poriferisodalis sp.]|uniref:phosphotransferase family protein n=1 Tax=Candidatus Poriferisodalis sp. TaxID=3101277 RepID=UPI003D0BEA3E